MRSEPWGGKAFCAGGDVRAVYEDGLANETGTAGLGVHGSITGDFFRKEYVTLRMVWYGMVLKDGMVWYGMVWWWCRCSIIRGGGVTASASGRPDFSLTYPERTLIPSLPPHHHHQVRAQLHAGHLP